MMKLSSVASAVALLPRALGHSAFGILLVNDTQTPEWKYVLDVAASPIYYPSGYPPHSQFWKLEPLYKPTDPNITCGRLAFHSLPHTSVATVIAGSTIGFRTSVDGRGNLGEDLTRMGGDSFHSPFIWHPGPTMIYLSRAPDDDLSAYRGEGNWIKIAYAGPIDNWTWQSTGERDVNFTIPKSTPPGKYLVRVEHFMPTDEEPPYQQFYINCALVEIRGQGGGAWPVEGVKFPGSYRADGEGLKIPSNQIRGEKEEMRLLEYKPPGPPVWTG